MGRRVKDATLDSREARRRLKARHEPYWRSLDKGAHLGYRKGKLGGTWVARWRPPKGSYKKCNLGISDDKADADGIAILNFSQAQDRARERFNDFTAAAHGQPLKPYTVNDAVNDYMGDYEARSGKATATLRSSIDAHIIPIFGEREIASLSDSEIRHWHRKISQQPARLRTSRLAKRRNHRPAPSTDEEKRRRRFTANKILSMLKAILNFAFSEGHIDDDKAWRRVKPFRGVDTPRIRYLTQKEAVRLVNACDEEFRPVVKAALLTGCRYGEIKALQCADFDPAGLLHIRASKSGKPRDVTLTEEGLEFFRQNTAGRSGSDILFPRKDGSNWGKSHQGRRLEDACAKANISPKVSFHALRHAYASWLAMKDVPLPVIAHQLGHSDTRICERHYAHLQPSYVQNAVKENFPKLGIVEETNVESLAAVK